MGFVTFIDGQCCQVKENKEEVNQEEHREHEEKKEILEKILRELRVLRGEKFLIVQHWSTGCVYKVSSIQFSQGIGE